MSEIRKRALQTKTMVAVVLLATSICASTGGAGEWKPDSFANEQTLKFLTVEPEAVEHWSKVWLVVIDDQIYVRLGPRAAGHLERNTTAPDVKVRLAGQEFDPV